MAPISTLRLAARRSIRPYTLRNTPNFVHVRPLSQTLSRPLPKKGAEDRESINTESSEHTKSSTDADAAQQDQAAYDPDKTSPEAEMESAVSGKKGAGNPLEVSGANKDVSNQRPPEEGGAEKSPKEDGTGGSRSGAGSSTKKGGP